MVRAGPRLLAIAEELRESEEQRQESVETDSLEMEVLPRVPGPDFLY